MTAMRSETSTRLRCMIDLGVATSAQRDEAFYRRLLSRFPALSHLTIEIVRREA